MNPEDGNRVREGELSDNPIQRAIDYGIDISLLEANLELSPLERLERHDERMNEALWLREQGKQFYSR